jgi:glucose-6-phosphate 1-dehydrogenase
LELSNFCSLGWELDVGAVATTVTPIENETPFNKLKDGLLSVPSSDECKDAVAFGINENDSTVSITVVGASGDLAKKKIFPALFALYYEDCLPKVSTFFLLNFFS